MGGSGGAPGASAKSVVDIPLGYGEGPINHSPFPWYSPIDALVSSYVCTWLGSLSTVPSRFLLDDMIGIAVPPRRGQYMREGWECPTKGIESILCLYGESRLLLQIHERDRNTTTTTTTTNYRWPLVDAPDRENTLVMRRQPSLLPPPTL